MNGAGRGRPVFLTSASTCPPANAWEKAKNGERWEIYIGRGTFGTLNAENKLCRMDVKNSALWQC